MEENSVICEDLGWIRVHTTCGHSGNVSHLVAGDDVASGTESLKAGWFWNVGGHWSTDIPSSYLLYVVKKIGSGNW